MIFLECIGSRASLSAEPRRQRCTIIINVTSFPYLHAEGVPIDKYDCKSQPVDNHTDHQIQNANCANDFTTRQDVIRTAQEYASIPIFY